MENLFVGWNDLLGRYRYYRYKLHRITELLRRNTNEPIKNFILPNPEKGPHFTVQFTSQYTGVYYVEI